MDAGYDKIKLWIDRAIVGDQYTTIADYLDCARQETDLRTGEVKTVGCLDGLKVSIFTGGVLLVGSFTKFLYGSNIYPLNRHSAAQAIEKIEDLLHIFAGQASVTGIEFGANFVMKHPVQNYLPLLGDKPRFERVQITPKSVRYEGRGKHKPLVLALYDKMSDATAKGMECPENLKGTNLFRYEVRYDRRISRQLGVPEVTASTLTQEPFYRMMVKRFIDYYFSISKLNQIKADYMSEIKTVTDAYDVFVARLISQTDKTKIWGFLDELKEAGVFNDRKNYSRLKKRIKEVATKADITISDELIKELDDEVKNSGSYL